jgi:hypothetical protein
MRYKTKHCEIEAEEYSINSSKYIEGLCYSNHTKEDGEILPAHIHTLEGVMTVNDGDFIIKGLKGEFYPCKPDIFHMKYEQI